MSTHKLIRSLPLDCLASAWLEFVGKGDKFELNGATHTVAVITERQMRLKHQNGKSISLHRYRNTYYANNSKKRIIFGSNFFRDVEGLLMVDLLNEFNPFHKPSDIFKIYHENRHVLMSRLDIPLPVLKVRRRSNAI